MLMRRSFLLIVFGPLLLGGMAPAWALAGDTFTLSAAYSRQTDSNLFRLPADTNLVATIGKPDGSEVIGSASLGFNINKAYSLQRLNLSIDFIDTRFQNFSYLNYVARNYDAAWGWSLTPRLHGTLGAERKEALNSFADTRNFSQPNARINTNTRFDAAYDMNGALQLLTGFARSRQTNQQAVVGEGDFSTDAYNLGLRYAYASGSAVTYRLNKTDGTYLNRVLSTPGTSDEGFSQTDQTLGLQWVISAKSAANLSASHISRSHPRFAQLDYSGLTTAFNFTWQATGKTALAAGWSHELTSYQTATTSYAEKNLFSIGPTWQVSPKAALRLRHGFTQTSFRGAPSAVPTTQRDDTTRDTSLSLDWQPYSSLSVVASLQKATRTSTVASLDFDSNTASLSARFTF